MSTNVCWRHLIPHIETHDTLPRRSESFLQFANEVFDVADRLLQRMMLTVILLSGTWLITEVKEASPALSALSSLQIFYLSAVAVGLAHILLAFGCSDSSLSFFELVNTDNKFAMLLIEALFNSVKTLTHLQIARDVVAISAGILMGKSRRTCNNWSTKPSMIPVTSCGYTVFSTGNRS